MVMAAIEFGLFLGALAMIGWVFLATLMPALPRIVALLTAEEPTRPTATVIALVPARANVPAWRAAA